MVLFIHDQRSRRPRRYRAGIDQMPILMSPTRTDPPVRGAVGGGEGVEGRGDVGVELDMPEAGGRGVGVDPAKPLVEPGPDLPEHDVVERGVTAGVHRPVLAKFCRIGNDTYACIFMAHQHHLTHLYDFQYVIFIISFSVINL